MIQMLQAAIIIISVENKTLSFPLTSGMASITDKFLVVSHVIPLCTTVRVWEDI
jgi:hypothetical protein